MNAYYILDICSIYRWFFRWSPFWMRVDSKSSSGLVNRRKRTTSQNLGNIWYYHRSCATQYMEVSKSSIYRYVDFHEIKHPAIEVSPWLWKTPIFIHIPNYSNLPSGIWMLDVAGLATMASRNKAWPGKATWSTTVFLKKWIDLQHRSNHRTK